MHSHKTMCEFLATIVLTIFISSFENYLYILYLNVFVFDFQLEMSKVINKKRNNNNNNNKKPAINTMKTFQLAFSHGPKL